MDSIQHLESALGIQVPDEFAHAIRTPEVHLGYVGALLSDAPPLEALENTIEYLIKLNKDVRGKRLSRGWAGDVRDNSHIAGTEPWHSEWLVIGFDMGGDIDFLDVSRKPAPVARWHHDSFLCTIEQPSFASLVLRLRGYGSAFRK